MNETLATFLAQQRTAEECASALRLVETLASDCGDDRKPELRELWRALAGKRATLAAHERFLLAECYFCHGRKIAYLYPNHYGTEWGALPHAEFQGEAGRPTRCPACKGVGRVSAREAALRRDSAAVA